MYVKFIAKNINCFNTFLFDFGDYDWKAALKMTEAMYPMCCQRLVLDRDTAVYHLHKSNEKFGVFWEMKPDGSMWRENKTPPASVAG